MREGEREKRERRIKEKREELKAKVGGIPNPKPFYARRSTSAHPARCPPALRPAPGLDPYKVSHKVNERRKTERLIREVCGGDRSWPDHFFFPCARGLDLDLDGWGL